MTRGCLAGLGAIVCALLSACGGATQKPAPPKVPVTAQTLYPMAEGWAWSYDAVARDGQSVLAISRVANVTGQKVQIRTGQGQSVYERRADGLFRVDRGGYLLKNPIEVDASWPSGGGMTARVAEVGLRKTTPAGSFDRCVEVVEAGAPSGLTVSTVYCPEVGPVSVHAQITVREQKLEERATLRGFAAGQP